MLPDEMTDEASMWDNQIVRDLELGRLDALLDDVAREIEAKFRKLPDDTNNCHP